MSKRFTDTDKYKKPFIRSLPGAYKLLWDYLYHECNHAGIWIVEFEIAQIYLGKDMQVDHDTALKLFNQDEERVFPVAGGKKWFIKPFIDFQYGELNPENRVHKSVISLLKKEKIEWAVKGLKHPLQGCKDKDTNKDKDKDKDKDADFEKNEKDEPQHKPDSIEEVIDFFADNGRGGSEAEKFFHHYEGQGWVRQNGMAITSWQSIAMNWIRRETHDPPEWKNKEEPQFNPVFARRFQQGFK